MTELQLSPATMYIVSLSLVVEYSLHIPITRIIQHPSVNRPVWCVYLPHCASAPIIQTLAPVGNYRNTIRAKLLLRGQETDNTFHWNLKKSCSMPHGNFKKRVAHWSLANLYLGKHETENMTEKGLVGSLTINSPFVTNYGISFLLTFQTHDCLSLPKG